VQSLASYARFFAVSCVLTAALRVAIVAFGASPPPPAASASASAVPLLSAELPRIASATAAPAPRGKAIRVRMSITAGPDRSDVYVDGSKLGQVPYLGDTSCRAGESVSIEIVPKTGNKLKFERTCELGTLRVE
jgi:hypothetical protein